MPLALDEFIQAPQSPAPPRTDAQQSRIAAQILRALRHGTNREFRRHASLAPTVATPLLQTTLAWCARSCEPTVARRARYVLSVIESA